MFLKKIIVPAVVLLFSFGCKKSDNKPADNTPEPVDTTQHPVDTTKPSTDTFTNFLIKAGKNYCERNAYPLFHQSSLKFKAIFDSSCIYTNTDPTNQADINKLYGFADCSSFHQANSARFGWNWMNGALHIHAYCYVDSVRVYKELGTVALNTEYNYSIEAEQGMYIFTLNNKRDTMTRHCSDTVNGYKLFPYFGGDETAPHDVRIRIKEVK